MPFQSLIDKCSATARAKFGEPVRILLAGVTVKTITAIVDVDAEIVSPYEAERMIRKTILSDIDPADFTGIDGNHDIEARGVIYKLDGKPRPDGAGMLVVYLAKK